MQHYRLNPQTLRFEPTSAKVYNFKILGLIAMCLLFLGFSSAIKLNTIIEKVPVIMQHQDEPCNEQNVKAYLKKLNIRFDTIVYKQIVLESAHFTSPVFKQYNNLLGMDVATSRATTGTNVGVRFARYNSWKESIEDYALWQEAYTREIKTKEEYYYFLDKVYCSIEQVHYSRKLKEISY